MVIKTYMYAIKTYMYVIGVLFIENGYVIIKG